ncbi:MAG TPA: ABC transporter permease, partial [Pirellulales bacterium]|nr:ABC transporter permease [Pirellulales bacterium]
MRAYFSVIVDAFQAAMASRVLWLLLFVITAILLALAPFGSHRVLSTQLTLSDIRDPFGLGRQLYKEFNHRSPSPGKRIWQKLDPDMQRALREVVEGDQTELRELSNRVFDLQVALNNLLDDPDLYHVTSWANVALSEEAQALMDRGNANLSEDEVRRLNRLLIEAAYPNLIAVSPPTSVQFSYAKWKVFSPFPLDEETFSQYLRWALSTFMGFFVGTFAVLLAILVTAPIVPQMLETGGIELLLSKPISRWLLFLAKFFGGCIFILLNTVYLVVGLWLIVGWRFGVWEHRMLLCIPIFMFLFMIYYSVSVLAGLVWRSAIMCVFATVLFWAVCFLVGAGKKTIERLEIAPSTIVRLIPAGDTLIAVNQRLQVQAYENGASQWEQLYQPDAGPMLAHGPFARRRRQPRMMGPIYRAGQQQLISAVRPADFRGGTRDGVFLHGAQADNGWSQVPVAELPAGAMWLGASSSGDVTVVGRGGVYRIDGDQIRVIGRTVDDALFDELPSLDRVYQADSLKLWSPTSVAKDPSSDSLVVRTAVGLSILRADDAGFYKEIAQRVLESNDDAIAIGYAADTIVTAGAAGQLRTYDSKTLEPEQGMGMGMGVGVGVTDEKSP